MAGTVTFGSADYLDISYLLNGLRAAESVARLRLRSQPDWMGNGATAFLVGPELLLANHHILQTKETAQRYQVDFEQSESPGVSRRATISFALEPERCFIADANLDYALVAVAPRSIEGADLLRQGWLWLRGGLTSHPGDAVSIIHHPLGASKRIALRENKVVSLSNPAASGVENIASRLWYICDVTRGSSGAPVLDDAWRVVALHSGDLLRDPDESHVELLLGDKDGELPLPEDPAVLANEGVVVGAILEDIGRQLERTPNALAAALLKDGPAHDESFGGHQAYSKLGSHSR